MKSMKKFLPVIGISFLLLTGCASVESDAARAARLDQLETRLTEYQTSLDSYEQQVSMKEEESNPLTSDTGDLLIGGIISAILICLFS
ncbi:MAG: hypothetical protein ACI4QA_06350 [Candidatus Spyradosoma sp.]